MNFDFDSLVTRRDTNSDKWDAATDSDILPMWVADMDFRTAPCVIEALRKRVDHGVFGYTKVPDEYFQATIDWFGSRHGLKLERDWMLYTSGVVPAISAVIKAVTRPGDGVIVQTPVYNCFFSSIRNNGCTIVENPLIYTDSTYRIDFDDLRAKAALPEVKALLLCNPHNPGGRVWTPEELRRIGEICHENNVRVISDEIHCELVYPSYRYTPFASLGEEYLADSITCVSPSKAFNTAGLQIANIFVKDPTVRQAIDRAININEVCDVNPFGVVGLIAAYRHGGEWLEALRGYLLDNYRTLCSFFASELPSLGITRLEGTYLVWVDCRSLGLTSQEIETTLYDKGRVWINAGTIYGQPGEGFIRINIACPRERMMEGLHRIRKGFAALGI
ncbi:MAG: pyridoxal phosphate-dependent aminotransferase [Bacteroides sp.]|nr:pyridoxal phosphate-dependent aminotransferase [Bacteroides sp.]MBD5375701.1 pyridoxal phosphate-dependent aminotransferase [Bacteroides sp.]